VLSVHRLNTFSAKRHVVDPTDQFPNVFPIRVETKIRTPDRFGRTNSPPVRPDPNTNRTLSGRVLAEDVYASAAVSVYPCRLRIVIPVAWLHAQLIASGINGIDWAGTVQKRAYTAT